jgi:LPXTG-site transpeptidase (sortase) family protein
MTLGAWADRAGRRSVRARWAAVAACLALGAGIGAGAWPDAPAPMGAASSVLPAPPAETLAPPASAPTVARSPRPTPRPVRLDIAGIDLSTKLIRLGLAEDRTVEVPTDPDRAGWFDEGPAPGATGSSVILGHVDSVTGPAVFARLDELERGDLVRVRRTDGSVLAFEVVRVALYANADFPAQQVYATPGARRLNLVTCGGEYDADRGGYQSNLVVYTKLVSRS